VKKKRFSVEQITSVLQQVTGGVPVGDVCRQVGISEQTFYRWKKQYAVGFQEEGTQGFQNHGTLRCRPASDRA
jgi:putative transposase